MKIKILFLLLLAVLISLPGLAQRSRTDPRTGLHKGSHRSFPFVSKHRWKKSRPKPLPRVMCPAQVKRNKTFKHRL